MSGDVLTEAGHHFIGMDISTVGVPSPPPVLRATFSPCRREPPRAPHVAAWLRRVAPLLRQAMLNVAVERESEGELLCMDMGHGIPFRPVAPFPCSPRSCVLSMRTPRRESLSALGAAPFPARRHQISRSQTRHSRRLHQHIRRAVAVQRRPQRPHPGAASLHLLRDSLPRAGARCARLPAVLPGEQGTDGPDHELRHESGPVKHSTLAGTHPSFPALGQPCSEKCATV